MKTNVSKEAYECNYNWNQTTGRVDGFSTKSDKVFTKSFSQPTWFLHELQSSL